VAARAGQLGQAGGTGLRGLVRIVDQGGITTFASGKPGSQAWQKRTLLFPL
jgi:hypothetical protein